jgi:glutamate dehydrogenase (NADP+)
MPRPEDLSDLKHTKPLPSEAIIGVAADILVLGALEDAANKDNVHTIKAGLVVELANGPVTNEGAAILESRGIPVLPDVIVNAGGVIVSYLEWEQNNENKHWLESEVFTKMGGMLEDATHAMLARADKKHITYKQAAFELALERLFS